MKKPAAPSPDSIRRKLLIRIREAEFPRDVAKFTSPELEGAGLFRGYSRSVGWTDATFRQFVLFAEQVKELRKESEKLKSRITLLEKYYSPLWDEVWKEPCPIKQAGLRRDAEADDARCNEQHRKERNWVFDNIEAIIRADGSRNWKTRDKRRIHHLPDCALWHNPMSLEDYHKATGLSRRTLQNVLYRLDAKPIAPRKRRNDAANYSPQTNYGILRDWLVRHVKVPHARQGLLARTLLHCQQEAPKHYDRLFEEVRPVLKSLCVLTPAQDREFSAYLEECRRVLYPVLTPPSPLDPFNAPGLLGLFGTPE
jgi:hypothetical protein